MAIIDCPGCGGKISDRAPACVKCGLTRDAREAGIVPGNIPPKPPISDEKKPATERKPEAERKSEKDDVVERLNCLVCGGQNSMERDEIQRFSDTVRGIASVILLLCLLGVVIGALVIVGSIAADVVWRMRLGPLAEYVSGMSAVVLAIRGGILVVVSVVCSVLGYILISPRRVWRCTRCGSIIDRA